jgi:LAO/AO transport system kinase
MMAGYVPSTALIERVAAGEIAAIGRLISRAEAGVPEARGAIAEIYRRAGRAHVIGIIVPLLIAIAIVGALR